MIIEIWQQSEVIAHSRLITDSYGYWTSKNLFPEINNDLELSHAMYFAPLVIVSHGLEKDPVFNYGNLQAQQLWHLSWQEFTSMPSRLSAEPIEADQREKLLVEGRKRGITYLEQAIRISKDGKRFYIKDVTLFNLQDDKHTYLGQAAIYAHWEFI
ncbi:MEKHLA domain-containing protein [soil metagenome]